MATEDEQRRIYRDRASLYDRLVRAEDCDRVLLPALREQLPFDRGPLLEIGAGTGRITRQLAESGARVIAFDREPAMLRIARGHAPGEGVAIAVADARAVPVASGSCAGAVAGWVFGHFRLWMPEGWQDEVTRAVREMRRAVRRGGHAVVLETLGTGTETAAPPTEALAEYYAFLEELGFRRVRTLATDYRFMTVEEAVTVLGAFFGPELAAQVRRSGSPRVPERTGLWVAG